ncbi:hypothetical protein Tco_0910813 [Tanacetum coccineum]|uniref:Uncharacterized protein n=1 Tax=Tanacetum coccineum TaxID=301880 RepID=A0ABQ5CX52_9ASTR
MCASSSYIPTDVPTGVAHAGISNKGKTPMVEEDITVKERTLKQMEDDRLGEEAAKSLCIILRLIDHIDAQVEANVSLSKTLLGDDVTEDNFPAKVESFTDAQLKEEFEKIQKALANTQVQAFTEATIPSVPDVPQPPVGTSPKSSGTRRKSLGRNRLTKPKSILKNCDSTPLGEINALYSPNQSTETLPIAKGDPSYGVDGFSKSGRGCLSFGSFINLFGRLEVGDVSYPLSVKLMERMLKHKLEIAKDVVGNDMTTAEQLIRFIKNQLAAAQFNKATQTANYMALEGVLMKHYDAASSRDIQLICAEFSSIQVKTQADWMYVVPTGKVIIIVSTGRLSLVPTGRVLSPSIVK